jgi:hypothetical protein
VFVEPKITQPLSRSPPPTLHSAFPAFLPRNPVCLIVRLSFLDSSLGLSSFSLSVGDQRRFALLFFLSFLFPFLIGSIHDLAAIQLGACPSKKSYRNLSAERCEPESRPSEVLRLLRRRRPSLSRCLLLPCLSKRLIKELCTSPLPPSSALPLSLFVTLSGLNDKVASSQHHLLQRPPLQP